MTEETYAEVTLITGATIVVMADSVGLLMAGGPMQRVDLIGGGQMLVNPEHVVMIEERDPNRAA